MEPDLYLIWLYCQVERIFHDLIGAQRMRKRGPMPALTDIELITIEVFCEYQGYGTDKAMWRYIRQHWIDWFPAVGSYKNFTKHCANLYGIKARILQKLTAPQNSDGLYIVDGVPLPVCKFARAPRCGLFPELANHGYCASKKEHYYGMKGVLIITGKGHIRGFYVTSAGVDEREALLEMDLPIKGDMIGDKGFIGERFTEDMARKGITMHTPLRSNMQDPRPRSFVRTLMNKRRYIETVLAKLIDQFAIVGHKARGLWRLKNKIARKLTSYMLALQFHGSTRFLNT